MVTRGRSAMDSAPGCEPGGCGFKSHRSFHIFYKEIFMVIAAAIKDHFRRKEVKKQADAWVQLVSQLYDKVTRNKDHRNAIDQKLQNDFLIAESDIRYEYIERLRYELRNCGYNSNTNYSEDYKTCIRELLVWCLEHE